uniref:Uncharacterized protein n=1 Tax=Mustela putorius furo TaxID=9669 RepID=M3YSP2_MUSPF
ETHSPLLPYPDLTPSRAPEESLGAAAAFLCAGAGHHFLDHLPGLPSHLQLYVTREISTRQDQSTFTLSPEP